MFSNDQAYYTQESSTLDTFSLRLDEMLASGTNILTNLSTQRAILKGAQRRMLSSMQGIRDGWRTLQRIDWNQKASRVIFWSGVTIVTLAFYFLIYRRLK